MFWQHYETWGRGQSFLQCISSGALQRRLAETIAWCDSLGSLSNLRSPDLRLNLFHQGPDDALCQVGRSRQVNLVHRGVSVQEGTPKLGNGRLLVYFPGATLSDGYAEVLSQGFFDACNLPPFDTWVTFFEDSMLEISCQQQLLCYVPPSHVDRANAGIEGNPEECILWLEQTQGSTRAQLSRLLGLPEVF
jgi:hypothetical protein